MKIKFTNLQLAQEHLKSSKYRLQDRFVVKSDRCYIYKHRTKKKYVKLSSKLEYLNEGTLVRGTMWTAEYF